MKNFFFLGSTGAGKSSTENNIIGLDYFKVGHELTSCTSRVLWYDEGEWRIFDTPGFGDNRMSEEECKKMINEMAEKMVDKDDDTSGEIDAFVLVCQCTPRATNLKKDLEYLRNLFGTVSFKSTVIVLNLFYTNIPDQTIFSHIREMTEVKKMLEEGKQEPFNEDWFCLCSNPPSKKSDNQVEELKKKS